MREQGRVGMGEEKIVDEQKRPVVSGGMKSTVPALHIECNMEGRRSTRDQLQSFALVSIRTICPAPAVGTPKPMFETYSLPSGPKVIPVGKVRPVATVLSVPSPLTHTTVPEPTAWGPGKPATVSVSRAYRRPRASNATPSTAVRPEAATLTLPLGVSFKLFWVPGRTAEAPNVLT